MFLPRILALMSLLGLLAGCAQAPGPSRVAGMNTAAAEVRLDPNEARRMINRYRARRGLNPLKLDARLARAAERQARDLSRRDTVAHRGSDGSDPWIRIRDTGFSPRLAAENVGAGQRSLSEVFRSWQRSPGHDRNLLLADATHMGIALVTAPGTRYGTFWALVLGTPR